MSTPGTVLKVRGDDVRIQLANDRTITIALPHRLSVGDIIPADLLHACERLLEHATAIKL